MGNSQILLVCDFAPELFLKSLSSSSSESTKIVRVDFATLLKSQSVNDYDVVFYFCSYPEILSLYLSSENKSDTGNEITSRIAKLQDIFPNRPLVLAKPTCLDDPLFGLAAAKSPDSLYSQIQRINREIDRLAEQVAHFHQIDTSLIIQKFGIDACIDPRLTSLFGYPYTEAFFDELAKRFNSLVQCLKNGGPKCVVFDLDNTLWPDLIGEDVSGKIEINRHGPNKVYADVQLLAKELKKRGILLAIASKNDKEIVKAAFASIPGMILTWDDFVSHEISWARKSESISKIARDHQLSLESIIFIDDDMREREEVKSNLPDVRVLSLSDDPASFFLDILKSNILWLEKSTREDSLRVTSTLQNKEREAFASTYQSHKEFLMKAEQKCRVETSYEKIRERVHQLNKRANQFNLNKEEFSKNIDQLLKNRRVVGYSLRDRFGDHGIVSFIVYQIQEDGIFIENWATSCRAFNKDLEAFVLHQITSDLQFSGSFQVSGKFRETPRSGYAKETLMNLGFDLKQGHFFQIYKSCPPLVETVGYDEPETI